MLRRIAVAVGAAAVLMLLAGCIAVPHGDDSRTGRLPLGIPETVVADCERTAGLGGSAPITQVWRDSQGLHVSIGLGAQYATGTGLSNTEYALLGCLTAASGMTRSYPSDSAGLLLLWKYSVTSLWPCFTAHGAQLSPPPSRADFVSGDPARFDPLFRLRAPLDAAASQKARAACPLVPDYLTPGAG